jgi:hypothetical protein
MSYSVNKTVTISGTVSVDCERVDGYGQNARTSHYTKTVPWQETVHLRVDVEDDVFNAAIAELKSSVNGTTGAVVATNSAQTASKHMNSRKVGRTLVNGFNGLIASEITQQMVQIKAVIHAEMQKLVQQDKDYQAIRSRMEEDYNRTSSRYIDIFGNLDNELSSRLRQLDAQTFMLDETDQGMSLKTKTTGVLSSSVGEAELSFARTALAVSKIRANLKKMLSDMKGLVAMGQKLRRSLKDILHAAEAGQSKDAQICVPAALFVADGLNSNEKSQVVFCPPFCERQTLAQSLLPKIDSFSWSKLSENSKKRIETSLFQKMQGLNLSEREAKTLQELWKTQTIQGL